MTTNETLCFRDPPHHLRTYLHRAVSEWQIPETIRRMVQFGQLDLCQGTQALGRFVVLA